MTPLEAALAWHDAGFCTIPPAQDGKKRPAFEWKQWQSERPKRSLVEGWYGLEGFERTGVGIVCGAISGNLEMLELEGCATSSLDFDAILWECQARSIDWLWETLLRDGYAEWTPSGGLHFFYRVDGAPVPGNKKVAQRLATEEELAENPGQKRFTLAETRGEGGWVIVAPSHGNIHPTKQSWTFAAGEPGRILTITQQQRDLLCESLHAALDKMPEVQRYDPPVRPALSSIGSQLRPGDDYAARMDWGDILEPLGYRLTKQSGLYREWERPGKNQGSCSVTTGKTPEDRLYCFSSNDPYFEPDAGPYNKFAAYVQINFGHISAQNLHEATKRLASDGYGTPATGMDPDSRLVFDSAASRPASAEPAPTVEPSRTPEKVDSWRKSYSRPALAPGDVLAESFDMRGAGSLYAKAYEDGFKYCGAQKKWMFWDGSLWQADKAHRFEDASKLVIDIASVAAREAELAEEPFAKKLRRHVEKMSNSPSPNIPRWALSDERIAADLDDFDAIDHLVTVENGILDLKSMTIMPHDPKMLQTKKIPVKYDKDAESPKWDKYLSEVLPDTEVRRYLQKAVGHALLGRGEQRAVFLLHGESGCGKSQFVRAMELLFGDFAETATPATFNGTSKTATLTNDLNDLKGKRFVTLSELDEGEVLNESLIKRLSGGDTAKSRGLWEENSKWRVKFSLFLATNHLPKLNSDDSAIWRRVKPIEFPNIIKDTGTEILALAEKIFAQESAGILNWVLEGVTAYLDEGLDDLHQIRTAVDAYRKEVDVVEQFLDQSIEDERLVVAPEQTINPVHLHNIYAEWCKTNNIKFILQQRRFLKRVERAGFARGRTNKDRFIAGIGIGSRGMMGTMHPVLRQ